ncbi:hypothetical protein ACOSQ3_033535 [Xanthoceras sorbifolium]
MAQPNYNINSLIIFCFTTLFVITGTGAVLVTELHSHGHGGSELKKLFVFGDSYADTGNCRKSVTGSWKPPYGITFPGKPAGRFSDGRVLTDYIASYLGIKSPIAYKWRKSVTRSQLQYGMNFAHGGTGVFNTLVIEPNMSTQVKLFQQLLEEEKVYTRQDLNSSIALVSLAGNDYATFLFKNGNLQNLPSLTISIVSQLVMNLKSIQNLGVERIVVTGMEPMGCLPQLSAFSSYNNCSESWNSASIFHNQILQQELQKLNSIERDNSAFITLDLYSAFMSALKMQPHQSGNSELRSSLEPCCVGVSDKYSCGSVDEKGEKKYTVCKNPELSIFWDNIHPAQNGWHAVFSALKSSPSLLKLH